MKTVASLALLCATLASADVNQKEAIAAIPYIGQNFYYQKLISYFGVHHNPAEILPVKIAIQERKKYLESWRDGYYTNYSLFWLMFHLFENSIVGAMGIAALGGAAFVVSKDWQEAGRATKLGAVIMGGFMVKNILGYTGGCLSSIYYAAASVDLQISRLETLFASAN